MVLVVIVATGPAITKMVLLVSGHFVSAALSILVIGLHSHVCLKIYDGTVHISGRVRGVWNERN